MNIHSCGTLQWFRQFFLVVGALVLSMAGGALAADIRLVEQNRIVGAGEALLDLNPVYSEAIGYVGGLERSDSSASKARSKAALKENYGWLMEPDFSGDGALTYESAHMPAAWLGLKVGRIIKISGQIERGDAEALSKLVADSAFSECESEGRCPFNNVISFDSPGGNFAEAIRMAEYIRSQNFITVLERGARCESACVVAFLAGYTNYGGFFFPRRFAHETATLGVHQPFIQLPEGTYSSEQVSQVVGVINTVMNSVTEFFVDSGVSLRSLRNMYATPPESMYRLSLDDLASEAVFVFGEDAAATELDRELALAFCASAYNARFGSHAPVLLDNLRSDERTFLTFDAGRNFVCTLVRNTAEGDWSYSICDKQECLLSEFGQYEVLEYQSEGVLADIATYIDNTEVGITMREFVHRTALLEYMRLFASKKDHAFKKLPQNAMAGKLPDAYCGKLDAGNAGLVRLVQVALNDNGIDVGKPDGSAGPNTRRGIAQANRRLLGAEGDGISPRLLDQLGVGKADYGAFELCGS